MKKLTKTIFTSLLSLLALVFAAVSVANNVSTVNKTPTINKDGTIAWFKVYNATDPEFRALFSRSKYSPNSDRSQIIDRLLVSIDGNFTLPRSGDPLLIDNQCDSTSPSKVCMDNLCGDKCTIYLAEYYHDLNDPEAHIHMRFINQSTLINVKNREGYNYNAANQQWIDCDKDESGNCIPNTDHLIFGQYLCFKNNPDDNAISVVNQDMPCGSSS